MTLLNFFAIGGAGLMQAVTCQVMERLQTGGAEPAAAFAAVHLLIGGVLGLALLPFCSRARRPDAGQRRARSR